MIESHAVEHEERIRPAMRLEMSMLHLLRHAKSSAKEDVDDHQRPLSRRGRKTARRVGKNLSAKLGGIDLVLCSSARRTRETLDLVLDEFSRGARILPRTSIEDELYLATREKLAARLGRLDPRDVNVLLIGHNPGLHELAVALADETSPAFRTLASGKFPTAAYVSFRVPADWSVLGSSRHELIGYVTPESLADEDE
jgi:phosphohistidine phosphatase